jgi:hypothetical protein
MIISNHIPGTEVPGYFHGVPLGRENTRERVIVKSANVSITDDGNINTLVA